MLPNQRHDRKNSTQTPSSFTGEWVLEQNMSALQITMKSDVNGTLFFDLHDSGAGAPDSGTTPNTSIPAIYESNSIGSKFKQINKGARWHRVRFVPDETPTELRIDTYVLRQLDNAVTALNRPLSRDNDAIVIRQSNMHEVMKNRVSGEITVIKFCRNPVINSGTTPEDIWNGGGLYPGLPTTAAEEFQVFSSSASDTSGGIGGRTVRVFYLDDDYNAFDANGDFLFFDVTLNGTTQVNTGVTGVRVWRAAIISSGSNLVNVGDITVRWRTTTSVVFAVVPAAFGNTQISNFTIPAGYTGYITDFGASMNDTNTNRCQISLMIQDFESNTLRRTITFSASTNSQYSSSYRSGLKITEKSDILMRVISVSNNGANVTGQYEVLLVKNLPA